MGKILPGLEDVLSVWEAVLECCCGLEVHKKVVVACLLVGALDKHPKKCLRSFETTACPKLQFAVGQSYSSDLFTNSQGDKYACHSEPFGLLRADSAKNLRYAYSCGPVPEEFDGGLRLTTFSHE